MPNGKIKAMGSDRTIKFKSGKSSAVADVISNVFYLRIIVNKMQLRIHCQTMRTLCFPRWVLILKR